MAHPKRRSSKARHRKRRSHLQPSPPTLVPCPRCGTEHPPHTVCDNCGYYKGKKILILEEEI